MEIERGSLEAQEHLSRSELWQALQASFTEFLAPPPGGTVLDVECGDGQLSLRWRERVAAVVGVDASSEQVLRAEQSRLEADIDQVSFQVAPPEALPFRDAAFDVISAFSLLSTMPDPARALSELSRVLRVGGIFGGVVPSSLLTAERLAEYESRHRHDPFIGRMLRRFYAVRPGGFTERVLERLLSQSGLRSMRTTEQADGLLWIVKGWR
jgi:ubiquinone/menaquinone biosynthesis C-methylase UbiE